MNQFPDALGSETVTPTDLCQRPALSKSLFVQGIRCQKLLWYRLHRGQEIPIPDESQQQILKEANEVGRLARKLFPGGRFVPPPNEAAGDSVQRTLQMLDECVPLFEASFNDQRCYVRVDVLSPLDSSRWEIVEVKSTTNVEDVHYWDLAIQMNVLRRCGLDVTQCSILHLNASYIRAGALDLSKLFEKENVTERVFELQDDVERKIQEMLTLNGCADMPDVRIGSHCGGNGSDQCPLRKKCWAFLPPHNVTQLVNGREKRFRLLNDGIVLLNDIPAGVKLSNNQAIQRSAAISGKVYVDKEGIRKFLNRLQFPLCFFDFESFATAVPMFDGLSAWQATPFQFSCHTVDAPGAEPRHVAFLADGEFRDPRPEFLEALKAAIGETGSLVAYHSSFEKTVLTKCAEAFPQHRAWLGRAIERIVDLEVPFRQFLYYHLSQTGRTTLKLVMPAIAGRGYSGMAIGRGDFASLRFVQITFGDVSEEERQRTRRELLEYCAVDSGGMIEIYDALKTLAE